MSQNPKYEYMVAVLKRDAVEEGLNDLGGRGWILSFFEDVSPMDSRVIMRREIDDDFIDYLDEDDNDDYDEWDDLPSTKTELVEGVVKHWKDSKDD
jgi:hypothetical protein